MPPDTRFPSAQWASARAPPFVHAAQRARTRIEQYRRIGHDKKCRGECRVPYGYEAVEVALFRKMADYRLLSFAQQLCQCAVYGKTRRKMGHG